MANGMDVATWWMAKWSKTPTAIMMIEHSCGRDCDGRSDKASDAMAVDCAHDYWMRAIERLMIGPPIQMNS